MARICFVSYEIYPTTWGGCGVLLHHSAARLLDEGHEVHFLLDVSAREFVQFRDCDRLQLPNPDACHAHHVDELAASLHWTREEVRNPFQWRALRFACALKELAERETLDYVEFFDYTGPAYYALMDKACGVLPRDLTIAVRLHNTLELIDRCAATQARDEERHLMYRMERAALRMADVILTPSRSYFDAHVRDFYGLDDSRVRVSVPDFRASASRPMPSKRDRAKIVYLGRLHPFKAVDQFVGAALCLIRRRPELEFEIELIGPEAAGADSEQSYGEYLRELIPHEVSERFAFTGFLDAKQIEKRLADADFAVFPNRLESFCYAAHEVRAAGVPVVLNAIAGFSEFFAHERDALFYDGTDVGLIDAMERLIDEPGLRNKLASGARGASELKLPGTSGTQELDFYSRFAVRTEAAVQESVGPLPSVLVVVMNENGTQAGASESETLDALSSQTFEDFMVVRLFASDNRAGGGLHWLGRRWLARDVAGDPVDGAAIRSVQAIVILRCGDVPGREWLQVCTHALRENPDLPFCAVWARSHERRAAAPALDLAPELYPFRCGGRPTRALFRTRSGIALEHLFDSRAGDLGEVALLWETVERNGDGFVLPRRLLRIKGFGGEVADAKALSYLVAHAGPQIERRLAQASPLIAAQPQIRAIAVSSSNGLAGAGLNGSSRSANGHQGNGYHDEEERFRERFVRHHAAYRLAERMNRSAAWKFARWVRHRGQGDVILRALGRRSRDSNGTDVWLLAARNAPGGQAYPWEFMEPLVGEWMSIEDGEAPYGRLLRCSCGSLKIILRGERPVLTLLRHPSGGLAEVIFESASELIDLYSPVVERIHVELRDLSAIGNGGR